jgi:hypothetical protein
MKPLVAQVTLVVSALAAPAFAYAQSDGPITRDDVRADLIRLEQAGLNPSVNDDATYPANVQTAEAKVSRQEGANDVGGAQSGSAASSPSHGMGRAGEHANDCVGPASFCTMYFGN